MCKEIQYQQQFFECDFVGIYIRDLKKHQLVLNHKQKVQCKCPNCEKVFLQPFYLTNHMKRCTSKIEFKCDECSKTFGNNENLALHKKRHASRKCDECYFVANHMNELKKHQQEQNHKQKIQFTCSVTDCGKTFLLKADWNTHKRLHNTSKNNICGICKKLFHAKRDLERHLLTHNGTKALKCPHCETMFRCRKSLADHIKSRHNVDRNYKCDQCAANFKTQTGLYHHKKAHLTPNYECSICHKKFIYSGNLKTHMFVHNGQKPLKCEHCHYETAYSQHFFQHLEMHERQKNLKFACNYEDAGLNIWTEGFIKCSIRCKTELHLAYHIERNHTPQGIKAKLLSERKLKDFFEQNDILFYHDYDNRIKLTECKNMQSGEKGKIPTSVRVDFFLPDESHRLDCLVFVENDEYQHASNACDLQRMFNITNALAQTQEHKDVPILFIRFNPHTYTIDKVSHSHSLAKGHGILLQTIQSIQPEDIKPGLNLVFVHYSRTNGKLDLFSDNNDFSILFNDCVLRIV